MTTNTPPREEKCCTKCLMNKGFSGFPYCLNAKCICHTPPNKQPDSKYAEGYKQGRFDAEMDRLNTKQPEAWQRTFLNAGTEKGLGDLSMMVGVVSEIITSQRASDVRRLEEGIKNLTPFSIGVQQDPLISKDAVLALLKNNK